MLLGRLTKEQRREASNRGKIATCSNDDCGWTGPANYCLIHPLDDIPEHEPWPKIGCPVCGSQVKSIKKRERDDI